MHQRFRLLLQLAYRKNRAFFVLDYFALEYFMESSKKTEPPHHHAIMKRSSEEEERYPVQDTTQSMGEQCVPLGRLQHSL